MIREIDKLEDILTQITAVTARTDAARREDLIAPRRVLSAHIHTVGQAGEPVFAANEELTTFREKLSRKRSMAAVHHSS